MSEKQVEAQQEGSEELVLRVDPFGHSYAGDAGVDLHKELLEQYAFVPDHETCNKGVTKENVEPLNIYEMTQTFKDQVGMEMVKRMIASGQASPEDFWDDAQHSGDESLPTDINTLHEYVMEEKKNAAAVVGALGGNLNEALASGDVEKYINGLVAQAIAAQQQQQNIQTEESK